MKGLYDYVSENMDSQFPKLDPTEGKVKDFLALQRQSTEQSRGPYSVTTAESASDTSSVGAVAAAGCRSGDEDRVQDSEGGIEDGTGHNGRPDESVEHGALGVKVGACPDECRDPTSLEDAGQDKGPYDEKHLLVISADDESMEAMPDGSQVPSAYSEDEHCGGDLGRATTLGAVKEHLPSLTVDECGKVLMCRRDWLRFVNCPLVMSHVFARLMR